jgi:hypothetical protein
MKTLTDELLEALNSVAGGCGRWLEGDPRISELAEMELVIWAEWRAAYEGDPTSGPAWVVTTAGSAYLAGYEHGCKRRQNLET